MAKQHFDRSKQHVNIGTINIEHSKTTLILQSPVSYPKKAAVASYAQRLSTKKGRGIE